MEGVSKELLSQFNDTQAAYPRDESIHGVFEACASREPNAVAVVCGDEQLTYAQLNARANNLARYLRSQGLESGEPVAARMPRGIQMLVAQIAILKSGAIYVPIDPELPLERERFILEDCGARWILVDTQRATHLTYENTRVIDCVSVSAADPADSAENLQLPIGPLDPAYVMYTSGSTGAPKGVVVSHRCVNRLAINGGYVQLDRTDRVAHGSNPAFDAATFEIWAPLLNGASVAILPQATVLNAKELAHAIERLGLSVMFLTTSLFNQHVRASAGMFAPLKYLLFGGEAADPRAVAKVLSAKPPQNVLNVYGPTETTVFATSWRVTSVSEDTQRIPIGRPISNTQVYILDEALRPVAIGEVGELYIGGDGVALGYLNRPELTAERFIRDPFSEQAGRLYRTGDLGSWRADGAIEYAGRNDSQVKIRGFRIELGEVEAALLGCPGIQEAIVVADEDEQAGKRLLAYVVTDASVERLWARRTRDLLKGRLPAYMVPAAIIGLPEWPLNANGKLDRNALPKPQREELSEGLYRQAQTDTERALVEMWKDLLSLDEVGVEDDFFELGGHSILGMSLLESVSEAFGVSIPVHAIFQYPTIRQMAYVVDSAREEAREQASSRDLELEEGSI
jgi:amino acid adenylation domain-containing protein